MNEILAELEKLKESAALKAVDVDAWMYVAEKNKKDLNEQVGINRTLLQKFEEAKAEVETLKKSLLGVSGKAIDRMERIDKLNLLLQEQDRKLEAEKAKNREHELTLSRAENAWREEVGSVRSELARVCRSREAQYEEITALKEIKSQQVQYLERQLEKTKAALRASDAKFKDSGYEKVYAASGESCALPKGFTSPVHSFATLYLKNPS